MDKYEFNIKVEQIKKLVNKGDFETAMKIADTIDWRRVRSTSLLTMISQIYEKNAEYQDAKDILLLAYERAPLGKGLLYKLPDLALRENHIQEAEAYYREFCELSGDDPRQYLLRFLILEAKDAPLEQQINSLERYCQEELDEKWLYHLAELYHQANQADDCVRICDKIKQFFLPRVKTPYILYFPIGQRTPVVVMTITSGMFQIDIFSPPGIGSFGQR